jgi:hypothetical protein
MNYEELKPWQISQLVHNQVSCDGKFDVTFENHGCQWRYKEGALSDEVFEFTMNEAKAKVKNYTSDINFAWPIIQSNGISLVYMVDSWEAHWLNPDKGMDEDFSTSDDDALIAAMICFLKMKDEENDI